MLLRRYLASLRERDLAETTIRNYRSDLSDLLRFLGARRTPLEALDADLLSSWMGRDGALNWQTSRRRLASARGFLSWLVRRGLLTRDPAAGVRPAKKRKSLPRTLTEEQVARLLAAPEGEGFRAARARSLLETLYCTGARRKEILGVEVRDLDLVHGRLRLRVTKGGAERVVPLGRPAIAALADWLRVREEYLRDRERPDPGALWIGERGKPLRGKGLASVVKHAARKMGLPADTTPHQLRHSCATHMIRRGARASDVQQLLGHESLQSTQVYVALTINDVVETFRASHPRA